MPDRTPHPATAPRNRTPHPAPKRIHRSTAARPSQDSRRMPLPPRPAFSRFPSRRSVVYSTNGIVACSQPLAAQAGLKVLRDGGNAADAAVAVAACLNVTEPTSTGIGGDVFCLYYDAATRNIRGLNGSGRSPGALTLSQVRADVGADEWRIPMTHVHAVTVPGAAAAWCDVVAAFGSGKIELSQVLSEAVRLAEEGHPVSQFSAVFWGEEEQHLRDSSPNYAELLVGGERAPREGEVIKMPGLARTMRELGEKGRKGFYEGWVAEAIVEAVRARGGALSMEDLKNHGDVGSEEVVPVSMEYGGWKLWECGPNGQGLVALMTLGILEALEKRGVISKLGSYEHNSAEYLHALIESLRIAFSDARWWIADPAVGDVPVSGLLDKDYLAARSSTFDAAATNTAIDHGTPAFSSSDTVYFSVIDAHGNGCSFINSLFGGFGSGIIPADTGFVLQNRGSGFALSPQTHPNLFAPHKRPYHTIIPALITEHDRLHAVFGVMGGFMQPQGHVQVFLNLLAFGMNPQEALDAPRISIGRNYDPRVPGVSLEEGITEDAVEGLRKRGHEVRVVGGYGRTMFGRGQVIKVDYDESGEGRVYSAGSDMRGDCQAVGY